jgi:CHAT domain-containing protein
LPNARPECEALHRFERDQASRARVLEVLSSERALHLACHGRAAGVDEGDAHLALSDGQLLADDLRRHPIRSPLVYLSACESAKGVLVPGEPSRGLAGALVDGGAQAVVATQWVLSDAAAPAMARTFWGALDQGLESSEALRLAREQASGPPGTWAGLELHLGQRSPVSRAALQISLVE